MILIVASRVDNVAQRLSTELPQGSARLLTPRDLSVPGWRVSAASPLSSTCIAGGEELEAKAITGVVCLLPCVFQQELVHIEPEDRAYVAAEMTALLVFWLSSLKCPKLNPPTAGCLSGPRWPLERWLAEAAATGLPVKPIRRSTRPVPNPDQPVEGCITVTVAGRHFLGHDDPKLRRDARSLASAVGVDLLSVHFAKGVAGYYFVGADTFPDLSQARATDAIWDFFNQGGGS
ncbi:MAG: hypothetical protein O6951_05310 [Actinobacteria bacterium]|nr:hypothetical protein [Actinomycetota bacterium]MCZ6739514.1 hypothetical protein [Actinomycetota bacterium]